MAKKKNRLETEVAFTSGDLSGLDALEEFQKDGVASLQMLDDLEASKGFAAFGLGAEDIQAARVELNATVATLNELHGTLTTARIDMEKLDKASPNYEKQAANVARLEQRFAKLRSTVTTIPAKLVDTDEAIGRISRNVGVIGDTEGALRATMGALSFAGAGGVEEVAKLGAEALAAMEALPKLQLGLRDLRGRFGGLADAFAEGAEGATTFAGKAAGGIGGMTAAIGPFAIAAGAAMAAILIFSKVSENLTKIYEEGKKAAEEYVNAIQEDIDIQRDIANAIRTADADAALQQLQSLHAQREDEMAAVERVRQLFADAQTDYATQNFSDAQKALSGTEEFLFGQITEYRESLEELIPILNTTTAETNAWQEALDEIRAAEAAREAVDVRVRVLQRQAKQEIELAQVVEQHTTESLRERLDAIELEQAALEAIRPELEAYAQANDNAASAVEANTQRTEELAAETEFLENAVRPLVEARGDEVDVIVEQLALMDERIATETEFAALMRDATVEQVQDRLQGIRDEQAAIEGILPELRQLALTSEEAAESLAGYETQLSLLATETARLTDEVMPEATARAKIEMLAEMTTAEAEADAKIEALRNDNLEALQKAEDKNADKVLAIIKKRSDKIVAINKKTTAKITEENVKFMRATRQNYDDFYFEEAQQQKEHTASILEMRRKLNTSLRQAEEDNDVVAFIRARRQADEEMAQLVRDKESGEQERALLFAREQERRTEEHDLRVGQINTEAEAARQATNTAFREARILQQTVYEDELKAIEKQGMERIAAEEEALVVRMKAIAASYKAEEKFINNALAAREERIAEEEEMLSEQADARLQREQEIIEAKSEAEIGLAKKLIDERAKLEIAAFRQMTTDIQGGFRVMVLAIRQSLQVLITEAGRMVSAARAGSGRSTSGRKLGGGYSPTAFAKGGIVRPGRPVLGVIGEGMRPDEIEVVARLKASEGLPAFMTTGSKGGGNTYVAQVDSISVGDGVSAEDVRVVVNESWAAAMRGFEKAKQGATA